MKKENLKYVWLAIFVVMVCTVITCQVDGDTKESIMEIKKVEEVKEVVKEAVEEVKAIEEVEAAEEVIEVIEEVVPEEAPIDLIPPVDTIERKEFYDENNWKYDDTVPQGDEDGEN